MLFKFKWFLNAVLTVSAIALVLSGLALFFQIWVEGIRELHKTASFVFIAASLVHIILNWRALIVSLKNKWAIVTMVLVVGALLLPLAPTHTAGKPLGVNVAKPADVSLPVPHLTGGKPLMQALKDRATIRTYADKKLSEQTISDLLWAGFGINRADSGKRTAPSARNWQEIELYVLTADGVFVYDAQANRLRGVLQGDHRQVAGMQGFVATAPLVLVYVADRGKAGHVSNPDWTFYSGIDTGFISQNVYLFCASEGLGTVVLGSVDRKAVAALLGLVPEKTVILSQPVGYPQ
jgi:SagB-type dehydrogenase family enzyme